MSGRPRGRVRIVGGRWRGQRLAVPRGTRPSADSTRETLFNWLAPRLPGARCLDLFAGSGALGLEALSRGAAEAWLVERDRRAAAVLERAVERLDAGGARVIHRDAMALLGEPGSAFDVVFLDPPFDSAIIERCCRQLAAGGWLAPGARVYVEHDARRPPALPEGWTALREGRSGDAGFALLAP